MSEPAKKKATYEDLRRLPENMIGEIVDGQLLATPRPAPTHSRVATVLGNEIGPRYDRSGEGGGPGGWLFLYEVEIKLGEHILVPDLAGWKRQKFPTDLEHNWVPVAPDWICEILSPGSLCTDRIKKMPLYAQFGVGHAWLIDPRDKTLDVYRLETGRWSLLGSFAEEDKARAEPFQEIAIDLADLWLDSALSPK